MHFFVFFFNLIKFWQITLEIVVAKWNSWSGLHTFASHWDFSKLQRLERDWWGEQRGLIHQQNYNRADFFWRSPSEVEKCRIDGNFQTLYVGGAWEHDGTKLLATNKNKHRHLACSETFFFFFCFHSQNKVLTIDGVKVKLQVSDSPSKCKFREDKKICR